jgi:hypothetical protein
LRRSGPPAWQSSHAGQFRVFAPIALSDGRTFATLRCAAECISHWPALEHPRNLLMTAAQTGKRNNIAAATDQAVILPVQLIRMHPKKVELPLFRDCAGIQSFAIK